MQYLIVLILSIKKKKNLRHISVSSVTCIRIFNSMVLFKSLTQFFEEKILNTNKEDAYI